MQLNSFVCCNEQSFICLPVKILSLIEQASVSPLEISKIQSNEARKQIIYITQ